MKRKLPLTETSGMAIKNLKSNKFRSLLTMLGIVIGNASVITLVGVGRGAQNLAENQLSNLGANVLFVVEYKIISFTCSENFSSSMAPIFIKGDIESQISA